MNTYSFILGFLFGNYFFSETIITFANMKRVEVRHIAFGLAVIIILPFFTQLIHLHIFHNHDEKPVAYLHSQKNHNCSDTKLILPAAFNFDNYEVECPICDYEFPPYYKTALAEIPSNLIILYTNNKTFSHQVFKSVYLLKNSLRGPPACL